MSEKYYLPVGFYFQLSIYGETDEDIGSFQEVSGISLKMETQQITEGGANSFVHKVPSSASYDNLVLKRGMMPKGSSIAKWCVKTLSGEINNSIETKTMLVELKDKNGNTIRAWSFVNAWPIKWSLANLDSMNTVIMVETLEFAYAYFETKANEK